MTTTTHLAVSCANCGFHRTFPAGHWWDHTDPRL